MSDFAGKEKRVLGTFVLMIGAGIVLESAAWWVGVLLMTVGAAALVWGGLEARPHGVGSTAAIAAGEAERSP